MADKTNFTKDEWALLLRSPMNAGMAITAAEPGGLWGLLKESFAGSAEMTHAATDPNANALVKAVVADFMTSEGRSVARDGLKAEFANSKQAEIKIKAVTRCVRSELFSPRRLPAMRRPSRAGCARSLKRLPKLHRRAEAYLGEGFRSATPKKRRLAKSPTHSASDSVFAGGEKPMTFGVPGCGRIFFRSCSWSPLARGCNSVHQL